MNNDELFVKLRFNIQRSYPFFSALSRICPFSVNNQLPFGADAGTSGSHIYFSDSFMKQKFDYQLMVTMHEVIHNAFKHPLRISKVKQNGDRQLFNIVADLKVNTLLEELKFSIPDDCVKIGSIRKMLKSGGYKFNDDDIDYICDINVSMEEAYERLHRKNEKNGKDGDGWTRINPGMGNDLMDKNMTDEERRELDRQINNAIIDGVITEKMRGNGNSNLVKIFNKLLPKNEVDWRTIVKNYIRTMLRGNRTWNKMHKKSLYINQILPGYNYKTKLNAIIAVDVSGSISDKTYEKFIGEIINLLMKHKCKIRLVEFDEKIKSDIEIKSANDFKGVKKRRGYGGTSYKDILEKYKNAKLKIVFTDGYGDQIELDTKYRNVIWLTTQCVADFSFGKVIKIKPE